MNKRTIHIIGFLVILLISFSGYSQNSDLKMQQLLKEKRNHNQAQNEIMGYRIQLYNGLSQTKAESIQGGFIGLFPDIPTRLFYKQPEWKVQVGNFRTKLEAKKALTKIREEFAGAFDLRTKIKI
jgi:hypothetical protein